MNGTVGYRIHRERFCFTCRQVVSMNEAPARCSIDSFVDGQGPYRRLL